jgi:hypothetical protein
VIEIRSYRRVFELERRIYRIDRLRLNPAGVPIRGIVYFLALLATSLVVSALPVVRWCVAITPWYMRDVALPALGAALLALIRVEGRPFHLAAFALLRYRVAPRRLAGSWQASTVGAVWLPPALFMLPDGSEGRIRRLRFAGPGAALVARDHELSHRSPRAARMRPGRKSAHGTLALRELPGARALDEPRVIVLERGTSLRTEPAPCSPRWSRRRSRPRRRARGAAPG